MAFDQDTRKLLKGFVTASRELLSEEFTRQLQNIYGLDPETATIAALNDLPSLSPAQQQTAKILRDTLEHYLASSPVEDPYTDKPLVKAALNRIVREQAFTVLNRLSALRMAEARQFIMETVSQGYQSKGFQLYQRIAGSALGETGQAYQSYLFSMFDELSLDLSVLFDRYSIQGRLFPRETVLLELLDLINHAELEMLWTEDETIGWIYQYWNVREEIDQARGESRAPRNSREMAVRNQFFTPRYVVEFLTDNTLGKTWHEMLQGNTRIKDHCDYLVIDNHAVFMEEGAQLSKEQAESDTQYIPHRKAKDPRCLRVIDPACGSGHFLLYVFDVLIAIYEEAWEKEPENGWPIREGFEPLHACYDSFEALQKDIPALIIANNLYGIDIDPRAIQIAGLAVWLRGQRYWNDAQVKPVDRPAVTRSNLICAESLAIEEEQLTQYRQKLPVGQSTILFELLNILVDKMSLAGEMGILLKLEKDIKAALDQVQLEYQRFQESDIQDDLFGREHVDSQLNLTYSVQGLNSQFFNGAENRLMETLRRFIESSSAQSAYKNKLFADDIASSLAFVDLMKLRFDAIVMNPPFGKPSVDSESYMEANYPDCPSDVYQAFADRGQELLVPGGFLGSITSRTGFFLGTFENWRSRVVLRRFRPLLLADLGMGVLDAMVETAAYVFRSVTPEEQQFNLHNCLTDVAEIETSRKGEFTVPKFIKARSEKLSREQALYELNDLQDKGVVQRLDGNTIKYQVLSGELKKGLAKKLPDLQYPKMACIRLVDVDDKKNGLIDSLTNNILDNVLETDPSSFDAIPGSPFSYWVADNLRNSYKNNVSFKSMSRAACQGIASGDDFRYGRMWWEVEGADIADSKTHSLPVGPYSVLGYKYQSFAKGGSLSPFFCDIRMVFNWVKSGKEVKLSAGGNGAPNQNYYYQKGFTWPLRTSRFSPAVLPKGTIFSVRSMSAFTSMNQTAAYITLATSSVFDSIYKLKLGRFGHPEFQAGVANVLPVPEEKITAQLNELNELFHEGYKNASAPYLNDETSRLYTGSWFELLSRKNLIEAKESYQQMTVQQIQSVQSLQKKVDAKALELYELEEADLPNERLQNDWVTVTGMPVDAESDVESFLAKDLLSNLFGKMFGRFNSNAGDIRNRDPFDPLPVPALDDELKFVNTDDKVLRALLNQGIAPVGRDFVTSLDNLLPELLSDLYPDSPTLYEEVISTLNIPSLSHYFSKPSAFFDYHLTQYSASSRIAPVYLPLSSSSGNFVVWLFYQKLSQATLYSVLNDVIEPTLKVIEEDYQAVKASQASSTEEAQKASLLEEIQDFRDEIQSVLTHGFQCDIDDGVVITTAPLRKLFKHGNWREELNERWVGLEAGDYEWAKLAYNYWPERVLKKCHEDRSIAIAHDVESDLWEEVEVPVGKTKTKLVWQPKDMSEEELEAYIQNKINA